MSLLRVVFAGTPEFSVSALAAIHDAGHEVCAVYTQPDRPAGRGRKLTPSPVKQWAMDHSMVVHQPTSLKDDDQQKILAEFNADVMVVVAYGLLLPKAVLDAPRYGCINIHASLLPKWRGAAPIQRAIESGDTETGVTIMQMDEGLDTGDMLLWELQAIDDDTTAGALHDKLSKLGARLIVNALDQIMGGLVSPQPQPSLGVTYAHKLQKAEAKIDWNQSAHEILRKINAFNPWPVAQTTFNGEVLRVWGAKMGQTRSICEPGSITAATKDGIAVATDDGELLVTRVQLAGKKQMDVGEFLNARPVAKGDFFGADNNE